MRYFSNFVPLRAYMSTKFHGYMLPKEKKTDKSILFRADFDFIQNQLKISPVRQKEDAFKQNPYPTLTFPCDIEKEKPFLNIYEIINNHIDDGFNFTYRKMLNLTQKTVKTEIKEGLDGPYITFPFDYYFQYWIPKWNARFLISVLWQSAFSGEQKEIYNNLTADQWNIDRIELILLTPYQGGLLLAPYPNNFCIHPDIELTTPLTAGPANLIQLEIDYLLATKEGQIMNLLSDKI